MTKLPIGPARRSAQAGMSLIETVLALAILLVVATGLMGLAAVAVITTENQGHLAARTAEYAHDKMEQLLSLAFNDAESDTISPKCVLYLVTPVCTTGAAGLTPGGSTNFAAPVNNYVDYLDVDGNPLGGGTTPPANWFYQRVWEITSLSPTLKRITVACRTRSTVTQASGLQLASTITTLKANPF